MTPTHSNTNALKIIRDATVVLPQGRLMDASVVIEGQRILDISQDPPASLLLNRPDVEVTSAAGCYLTPGLIDQHFHGGLGCDFNISGITDIQHLLEILPRYGMTGAVPTIMTASQWDMVTAGNTLEEVIHLSGSRGDSQCRILGIHLEGPFLNPEFRGAHPASELRDAAASPEEALADLQALTSPNVRLVTLAPELDEDGSLTRFLTQRGVRVSAGHSNATLAEMAQAVEAGVSGVTHLFNAMRPLHHREPGIVGAALVDERLHVELIGDGMHVHPDALRLALKAKKPEKLILISDCLALAGLHDGHAITFGNQTVSLHGGRALNEEGNLAGSALFLDSGLKNLVRWNLLRFQDAIQLASCNPAEFLGYGHELGKIAPGYLADLVLWDKETLTTQATWINGQEVYNALAASSLADCVS